MVLKLYIDFMSQPARAVYIFLKVNEIPFEVVPVMLFKGDHKTEEFAKINPLQKVPVIDDDGFVVFESTAILRYLMHKYYKADNAHWYPSDRKTRTRIDEYLGWHHSNTRPHASQPFVIWMIDPLHSGRVDKTALPAAEEQLNNTLTLMENVFLKDTPYLGSKFISIADILAICELKQLDAIGLDYTEKHPKIAAWVEKVMANTQPAFEEAHSKSLYKVRDDFLAHTDKEHFRITKALFG